MAKSTMTIQLSKESLTNAIKYLDNFKTNLDKGIDDAVEYATRYMYEKVKQYCYDNGIQNHTDNIYMEYDPITKTGRVYSDDEVIIFNEMGTGIVGSNNPHPNPDSAFADWKYDVNEHGEAGWKYPKGDGTYGWTRGLPSRHMFYSAYEEVRQEIGDIVSVKLIKSVGDLY